MLETWPLVERRGRKSVPRTTEGEGKERTKQVFEMPFLQFIFLQKG